MTTQTRTVPVYPPLDGSVLLSDLPDFNLKHNALLPAFVYSSAPGSITEISQLEFAHACHRVAHSLRPLRNGPEGEVVAIIANTDILLYQALIAGVVQGGLVVSIIRIPCCFLLTLHYSPLEFLLATLLRQWCRCFKRPHAIACLRLTPI